MDEELSVQELLDAEIVNQFAKLESLETGSAEKSRAINDLMALYDRHIQENKTNWDAVDKQERREMERQFNDADMEFKKFQLDEELTRKDSEAEFENVKLKYDVKFKKQQIKEQKKDRNVKIGIAVGTTVTEISLLIICLCYEQFGCFSLTTTRELFKKIGQSFKQK